MARLSRQESREQTRQRLKVAAYREFSQKGIQGASIDSIAESAGYSRGAFYANYLNKKEILLELLQENTESENLMLTELLNNSPDLDSFIPALEKRFDQYIARREQWMLSVHLMLESQVDTEFGEAYQKYSEKIIENIQPLIQKMIEKSPRKNELSVEMVSIAWRALSLGLIFETYRGGLKGSESPGHMLGTLLRRILC